MFLEHKNTYCVMTGKVINTIVLWAAGCCVMTGKTLCYDRKIKSWKTNIHKAFRGVFCLANHYITIYITMQVVDNSKGRLL